MTKRTQPPRQWKPFPLLDPRSQARRGGISIGPRDRDAAAKADKLRKAVI